MFLMRRRPEPAILIQNQLLFVPEANQTITTQHTQATKYLRQRLFVYSDVGLFSFCYVVIFNSDNKNLSKIIKKCNKKLKIRFNLRRDVCNHRDNLREYTPVSTNEYKNLNS